MLLSDEVLSRLPRVARDHVLQVEDAQQRRDHFGVIVWGAVYLEAILDDALNRYAIPAGGRSGEGAPDLGGQLSALAKAMPSSATSTEMLSRAHAIRAIRNRCVHNTGRIKDTLPSDAFHVADNLRVLTDWWDHLTRNVFVPVEPMVGRVFLSTITADNPLHRGFLADIRAELRRRGLEPVSCELSEYDKKAPMRPIAEALKTCDAMLVIGLERTRAYLVRDREGTDREFEETHRRYSSAWLDIEGGIAFGLGLGDRVFVLCEPGIVSAGVFDREWNQYVVVAPARMDINDPAIIRTLDQISAAVGGAH